MKSCLLCHTVTEDSAFTCPSCGHADWAAVAEELALEAPPATTTESPAPKKGKRSR